MGVRERFMQCVEGDPTLSLAEREERSRKIGNRIIGPGFIGVVLLGSALRLTDSEGAFRNSAPDSAPPGGVYAEQQVSMFPTDVAGTPVLYEIAEDTAATPEAE